MPRSLVQMTHPMRCAKQPPQSLKRLTLFEPRSLTRADCAARQRLTSVTRPAARCKRGDGPTRKHARSHARGASQHGNLWCGLSCMISAAAYALGGGPEARPPRPSPHLHALTSRMSVAARPALQPRGLQCMGGHGRAGSDGTVLQAPHALETTWLHTDEHPRRRHRGSSQPPHAQETTWQLAIEAAAAQPIEASPPPPPPQPQPSPPPRPPPPPPRPLCSTAGGPSPPHTLWGALLPTRTRPRRSYPLVGELGEHVLREVLLRVVGLALVCVLVKVGVVGVGLDLRHVRRGLALRLERFEVGA